MSTPPIFTMWSTAFVAMWATAALHAQDHAYVTARELFRQGDVSAALEHSGRACTEEPDSLDRLDLRIQILIAVGNLDAASHAQADWERLSVLKSAKNTAAIRQKREALAVPASPLTPPHLPLPGGGAIAGPGTDVSVGPRPPSAPTGSGTKPPGGNTADAGSPRGNTAPQPRPTKESLRKAADDAIAAGEDGDKDAVERLIATIVSADLHPETVQELSRLAKSPNQLVASLGRQALLSVFAELTRIIAGLFEQDEAAEADPRITSYEVAAGALHDVEIDEEAMASLQQWMRLGLPRLSAYALRRGEWLLGAWAGRIEQYVAANSGAAGGQEVKYRKVVEDLHAEADAKAKSSARRLGIVGSRHLARSKTTSLALGYRELLDSWAKQHAHAAAAAAAMPQRDDRVVADELESAFQCDSTRAELGLEAAKLLKAAGQLLDVARLQKELAHQDPVWVAEA